VGLLLLLLMCSKLESLPVLGFMPSLLVLVLLPVPHCWGVPYQKAAKK